MVIPNINTGLEHKQIAKVVSSNYKKISKDYISFATQWLIDSNKVFGDCEKFYILIYLFNKNLEFYNKNLIYFDYESFLKTNKFEVQKINIVNIAKNLNIPKESVRRKLLELEKGKIIQRTKKDILINKEYINLFDVVNNINYLSKVLFEIYNICYEERIINKEISRDDIVQTIKKNFSFIMFHYFQFIFPWVLTWKKFFENDIECKLLWNVIVTNKSLRLENKVIKATAKITPGIAYPEIEKLVK